MKNYHVYVYSGDSVYTLYVDNTDRMVIVNDKRSNRVTHNNVLRAVNFGLTQWLPDKVEVIPAD